MKMKKGFFLVFVFGVLFSFSGVFAEILLGNGSTQVTFTGGVGCYSSPTLAYWIIGSNETIFNSSGNVGNCSKYYNSSISGSRQCCPPSYDCNPSSGQCYPAVQGGCAQYNTSARCNADSLNVAESSFESLYPARAGICGNFTIYNSVTGASCLNVSVCSCKWNGSACGSGISYMANCSDNSFYSNKECNWIEYQTENVCDSQGKIIVTYTASGNALGTVMPNGVNCSNIQVDYPCSASVKLPFFGGFNFIIAVLIIACVYFVSSRKH